MSTRLRNVLIIFNVNIDFSGSFHSSLAVDAMAKESQQMESRETSNEIERVTQQKTVLETKFRWKYAITYFPF